MQNVQQFVNHGKHHKPRRTFTSEEDKLLRDLVAQFGEFNWSVIASQMTGRTSRQCRDRWKGYLSPTISTEEWTEVEDAFLQQQYKVWGPRWSKISQLMDGRSEIAVKNRWKLLTRRSKNSERKRDLYKIQASYNDGMINTKPSFEPIEPQPQKLSQIELMEFFSTLQLKSMAPRSNT